MSIIETFSQRADTLLPFSAEHSTHINVHMINHSLETMAQINYQRRG